MPPCPTLTAHTHASRLAAVPLADRARAVWTAAHSARHDPNWGRALMSQAVLRGARQDPHPRLRQIAEDCRLPGATPGPQAA